MKTVHHTIILFNQWVILILDGVELDEFHPVLVGGFGLGGVLLLQLLYLLTK